ncbi:MAG TPA: RMD1 family protein [Abditibacteriaceae bacterium]|jgi:uncharacterized Rmd1/YagE family protein
MNTLSLGEKTSIKGRALLLGEHLDLRALEAAERLADVPLMVSVGEQGAAVLFRYGAVVLFNVRPLEEVSFLKQLQPLVRDPFPEPELEEGELQIDGNNERVQNGVIKLRDFSIGRLQIVADVLAKSVVLAHYEGSIAGVFHSIEPFADDLHRQKQGRHKDRELLSHIGGILLIQHKMVGMVEVGEKPETLWEQPELERLYARLEDEYELSERHLALERKLALISRTAETVLNLLQHKSGMRVEWYIVVLIVIEIFLIVFEMFFQH